MTEPLPTSSLGTSLTRDRAGHARTLIGRRLAAFARLGPGSDTDRSSTDQPVGPGPAAGRCRSRLCGGQRHVGSPSRHGTTLRRGTSFAGGTSRKVTTGRKRRSWHRGGGWILHRGAVARWADCRGSRWLHVFAIPSGRGILVPCPATGYIGPGGGVVVCEPPDRTGHDRNHAP